VNVDRLLFSHDLGEPSQLVDWPLEYQDEILSTRVRVGRTVKGYPMCAKLTRDASLGLLPKHFTCSHFCFIVEFYFFSLQKRLELEQKIRGALMQLDGDLAGHYKSLTEMSYDERNLLIEQHILYNDADDKYLRASGGYHDWPVSLILVLSYYNTE
jgi:hypothetical protein